MSDEAFEQFLKAQSSGDSHSALILVMLTIRSKMEGIVGMYKATLDFLKEEPKESPTRKKVEHLAGLLITKAELTIDQFDYLITDTIGEDLKGEEDEK